mgnify:CR=1 FL=1
MKNIINKNIQFIKFSIIGLSNLSITLITYYILIYFNINYQISNILSFLLGSINGYYWNKKWVFQSSKKNKSSILKFYISYITTWLLSAILLYFWIEILHISKNIAPIINVLIITPMNYILNKKWTFK